MRPIRVALCQMNAVVGDVVGNGRKIRDFLHRASSRSADLAVFPELAVSGYPPEDLLLKPTFLERCRAELGAIARSSRTLGAVVGFPEHAGDLYNSAAILSAGKICGVYRKHFLPNYGVFDEDRYFAPGDQNPVFQMGDWTLGVTICEDIWHPTGPHEAQATIGGAQLLVNLSASPYHRGKQQLRERMLATRAADSSAALAFCNLVGGQDELVFDGVSTVFASSGRLVARGPQFAEDMVVADLELAEIERRRLSDPRRRKAARQRRHAADAIHRVPLYIPAKTRRRSSAAVSDVRPLLGDVEEVYRALVLGLGDYLRKNDFAKAVIGLSGGIDSSLVATLAVDALGHRDVVGVFMPSEFSSAESREDAAALAKALRIQFLEVPIQPAFDILHRTLRPTFGNRPVDVTEENLQARIRGMLLMALSNKFKWLVLTTGNKSENAVGYATLYGDMAGGFAAIKDVPKVLVYELCRYRNAVTLVIPENVLVKAPTAELRHNQKDTDSLPPYDVLDPILEAYVESDLDVAQLVGRGFDRATVRRVVRMVDRAEYKRRQGAPGVRITPRGFGKDRRLPITNQYRESG